MIYIHLKDILEDFFLFKKKRINLYRTRTYRLNSLEEAKTMIN